MKPFRLRTRLTAWYSFVLAVMLALFALTITWQQERIGVRRIDGELADLTVTLSGLLRDELTELPSPEDAARDVQHTLAATGRDVAILSAGGQALAGDAGGPAVLGAAAIQGRERWAMTSADGRWRIGGHRERIGDDTYLLLVAAPLADVHRERREALEAMWLGIPVLLALGVSGGLWLASVALRPITDMSRRATRLSADGSDDLGQSGRDDELGQFERAFNDLLARLRLALHTQRQFMADAAHELRTPVSVMRSLADVTLDRSRRDEAEYREALAMVGSQTRRIGRVLDDMLVLARADAGGYPLRPVNLYLNDLAEDCRVALQGVALERLVTIRLTAPGDVPFVGDEELLRRMLLNLVQNAVQHTRANGTVAIDIVDDHGSIAIAVTDEGPGIAAADRERIFDRFIQLDPARRQSGAGLGLPIARWIAEAHGGQLVLRSSAPAGSVFAVTLPMRDDDVGRARTVRPSSVGAGVT